jgi:uncharacterized protein (DUF1501 family)
MVSLGLTVPTFLSRTAHAAPWSFKPGAKDTILVVIELTGGNDGVNTVVPFSDPDYAKIRPTLKLPTNQLKKVTDTVGLHPSLDGLAKLYEDRQLCIVQGVGYPNPSQSHFRSMDIWQAGSLADELGDGWIGRALAHMNKAPAFHLARDNESAPLALTGAPVRAPSISSLEDFQLKMIAANGKDKKDQRAVIEGAAQAKQARSDLLAFVQRTAASTYSSSQRLQEIGKNYQPKATYPQTALANHLKLAAQLIDSDLGARIFYVSIDGFDTHANQLASHANLLSQVSGAMAAFYKDMSERGHKDRILMMTFSEFGRRAYENGSRGTDHGAAAPVFLVGGRVKPGVVGKHPRLTGLKDGNLEHQFDFRQVYAAVLDSWLGVPSQKVLGQHFAAAEVLKA